MSDLSMHARIVGYGFFGFMKIGGTLVFDMIDAKPSVQAKAGLDELIREGFITQNKHPNTKAGIVYTLIKLVKKVSQKDMKSFGRFPMTERI